MEPSIDKLGKRGRNEHSLDQDQEGCKAPAFAWAGRAKGKHADSSADPNTSPRCPSTSDDDDGEPETMSSKVLPKTLHTNNQVFESEAVVMSPTPIATSDAKAGSKSRTQTRQPKLPPRNPFASRPTLLRNVRQVSYVRLV